MVIFVYFILLEDKEVITYEVIPTMLLPHAM